MKSRQGLVAGAIFLAICLLAMVGWSIHWLIGHPSNGGDNTIPESTATAVVPGVAADLSHLPVVYATDFTHPPGDAWTATTISRTPKDKKPFLGQFGNDTVSLAVHALPAHDFLHLTCKLYIINTWDGIARHNGGTRIGPDYWSLDLAGGPNLIRSTFSNTNGDGGFAPSAKFQNYPAPIPSTPVLWGTGADSKNELGYIFHFRGFDVQFPMDTVYTIDLTIPHSAAEAEFDFTGSELQDVSDEGWGLADVKLEALPASAVPKMDDAAYAQLLNEAAGNDLIVANKSFWKLVSGGDAAVAYLVANVHSLGINFSNAKRSVGDVVSGNADAQAVAQSVLSAYGPAVEPLLDATPRSGNEDSPVKAIEEAIVIRPIESPARRRGAVASRVLTIINTDASKKAIDALQAASTDESPLPEDWALAMGPTFSLPADKVLKYIPPPWMPARKDYWDRKERWRAMVYQGEDDAPPRPMPSQLVFRIMDEDVDLTADLTPIYWGQISPGVYGPQPGLTGVLNAIGVPTGTPPPESRNAVKIVIPPTLENISLQGDWLIRHGANWQKLLPALEPILKEQTGRTIYFQKQKIDEDVIKVSGTYAFKPIDGADPANVLHVFAGPTIDEPSSFDGNGESDLRWTLNTLSTALHTPIVDTTGNKVPYIKWRMHRSARVSRAKMTPALVDDILNNVSKQTGLQFTRSKQSTSVIVAVEDPATTQAVEK